MLRWIVGLVVHSEHKRGVGIFRRRRNNHFFHRRPKVLLRLGSLGEQAGGLDHYIRANTGPVDFRRVLHLENLDGLSLDADCVVGVRNGVRQISQHGVIFQKVREGFGVRNIVDGDELDILVVDGGANNIASEAAKAVDSYLDWHSSSGAGFWIAARHQVRKTPRVEQKMLGGVQRKVNERRRTCVTRTQKVIDAGLEDCQIEIASVVRLNQSVLLVSCSLMRMRASSPKLFTASRVSFTIVKHPALSPTTAEPPVSTARRAPN